MPNLKRCLVILWPVTQKPDDRFIIPAQRSPVNGLPKWWRRSAYLEPRPQSNIPPCTDHGYEPEHIRSAVEPPLNEGHDSAVVSAGVSVQLTPAIST